MRTLGKSMNKRLNFFTLIINFKFNYYYYNIIFDILHSQMKHNIDKIIIFNYKF